MTEDKRKLFDAVYKSPGMEYLNRQKSHSFSYNIFVGNYEELKKVLALIENPTFFSKMMGDINREKIGIPVHKELNRHFHNYLAAAKSLIDHTRVFIKQYYTGTQFKSEFELIIKNEFASDPLSRFMQDLRNYMLHKGLLNSSLSLSLTKIHGTNSFQAESTACLEKSELIKWEKWSKEGKQYLLTCQEKIKISSFCTQYSKKVFNLYSWFEKELYEHHSEDYQQLVKAQKEFDNYRAK